MPQTSLKAALVLLSVSLAVGGHPARGAPDLPAPRKSGGLPVMDALARRATGVRTWVDRDVLSKRIKLRPDQRIVAAQSIGYPKK